MAFLFGGLRRGLDAVSSGDDRFQRMLDSITKTRMDDPEMTKAEDIIRTLRESLQRQEWVKETFLIGSYERRTFAKFPRHDIDVFCVVDHRHPSAPIHINRDDPTPRQLIRAVHSVTQKAVLSAYPGALVNSQKHSVGVFPTKGPHSDEHVTIDVIPAVEHDEPDYGRMYKIPERGTTRGDSGHLILSNPLAVKRELERKDAISNGKLLELVRLMKTWNQKKQNTKIIKNFHMELLCYEAAGEISDRSMSMKKACQVLFQYLSRHVQDECYVSGLPRRQSKPGDPSPWVVHMSTESTRDRKEINRLHNLSGLLGSAAKKSTKALDLELIGCQEDADKIWEEIFPGVY